MGNVGLPLANDSLFRLRCPTALPVPGVTRGRYIPSELGYGDSGSPPKIKGGDPLVFQMEIIKIKVRCSIASTVSVAVMVPRIVGVGVSRCVSSLSASLTFMSGRCRATRSPP